MKAVHRALFLVSVFPVMLYGCSSLQRLSDENEKTDYRKAIMDAAVIEKTEIATLPLIREKRVRVVTWTKYPDSYPVGQESTLKWGEVWVTLDNDVKSRCEKFREDDLITDIQKLLGLPPNPDEKRSFVTLEVHSSSLFRPCANPSLAAEKCSATFPDDVSASHASWYAFQTANSYNTNSGFPWTRLGYTYNWKAGENEIGAAEFVIKKGAKVRSVSAQDTNSYCMK